MLCYVMYKQVKAFLFHQTRSITELFSHISVGISDIKGANFKTF